MNPGSANRLAVCSWSLQPQNPDDLLARIFLIKVRRVQLALNPLCQMPATWAAVGKLFRENGIEIISGMMGCVGEDYSTLESIRQTGGIAPDGTWEQNLNFFSQGASLAARFNLKLVTFHAGFLPHEKTHPDFSKMLSRLATVAGIFAKHKVVLGLETGQETAGSLAQFLSALNHENVGVNFDPANMILYDKGDPVEALRILSPWLRQVHIKDATRTKIPGTWGREVPVGTGEVDWPEFFATLRELDFTGNLVIEREAGAQRVADIGTARDLVLKYL